MTLPESAGGVAPQPGSAPAGRPAPERLRQATPGHPAPFGRLLTAMVTPFTDDGDLDPAAAACLAEHLVEHGHDGLVISGTTGEAPTTTDAEQVRLLRAVVDAVGDRASVVAGVGTNDTRHSVERAQAAAAAGADGLLVVTPYYSKPPQDGILAHFRAVADATDLPVMVYDIPGRTSVKLSWETLQRAAEHPRVVAVKDASGDLFAGSRLMHETGLALYSGDDLLNLAWLALGAAGIVSVVGHVAGRQYADLIDAMADSDVAAARKIDRSLIPAVTAVMTRAQGAVMAKAALQLAGVLANRTVRSPLVAATDDQVGQLRADLLRAGVLAPGGPAAGGGE